MMEAKPEYGDAQLMTWNPAARAGWDDYSSRLHNEDSRGSGSERKMSRHCKKSSGGAWISK
jgi:hypothetical protein